MQYKDLYKNQIVSIEGEKYKIKELKNNEIIATKLSYDNPIYRLDINKIKPVERN